ncbi:MAG TPA: cytochrome c [Pyrinomonadaceae bacterium]|jgi:mono/diheme cytochrome c family protein
MQDQPRYEAYEASTTFSDGLSSRPLVEGTVPRGWLRADTLYYTGKLGPGQVRAQAGATQSGAQTATPNIQGGTQPGGGTQPAGDTNARGNVGGNAGQQQGAGGAAAGGANAAGANAVQAAGSPQDATEFPFPVTAEVLKRGQERFNIFCAMCHGMTGYGDGMIVRRGYRRPPSYHTDQLRQAPVGHFFDVITNGWGAMPDYAAQIPVQDRWAIIAYVRALQLSQQVPAAQVPPDKLTARPAAAGGHTEGGGEHP